MLVVGFDRPTITRAMELVEQYDFLYAAVGWHPVDAIDMTDEDLDWIESLTAHPKVVAIGEMGLRLSLGQVTEGYSNGSVQKTNSTR